VDVEAHGAAVLPVHVDAEVVPAVRLDRHHVRRVSAALVAEDLEAAVVTHAQLPDRTGADGLREEAVHVGGGPPEAPGDADLGAHGDLVALRARDPAAWLRAGRGAEVVSR